MFLFAATTTSQPEKTTHRVFASRAKTRRSVPLIFRHFEAGELVGCWWYAGKQGDLCGSRTCLARVLSSSEEKNVKAFTSLVGVDVFALRPFPTCAQYLRVYARKPRSAKGSTPQQQSQQCCVTCQDSSHIPSSTATMFCRDI